jgi:hypothetical protein
MVDRGNDHERSDLGLFTVLLLDRRHELQGEGSDLLRVDWHSLPR